jgi:hypothetical protein
VSDCLLLFVRFCGILAYKPETKENVQKHHDCRRIAALFRGFGVSGFLFEPDHTENIASITAVVATLHVDHPLYNADIEPGTFFRFLRFRRLRSFEPEDPKNNSKKASLLPSHLPISIIHYIAVMELSRASHMVTRA